ncbi:dehydrogenase E1 component subunit alpha/beta [Candidatus Omnitrophota bacterium]
MDTANIIKESLLIRHCEEKLLALFSEGKISGTTHTCIGQELSGIAVASVSQEGDVFFSNHRGHGHFISLAKDVDGFFGELLGRSNGVCGGIGGSQHLHAKNFFSSGIQGGLLPIAAGVALGKKMQKSGDIAVVFIGDGTFGEGVLYETFNICSKWQLPVLVIVEHNGIAQSTLTEDALAGSIESRARAFDITYDKSCTFEWEDLFKKVKSAVSAVRSKAAPFILEIETVRLKSHSKGDETRDSDVVSEYWERDKLSKISGIADCDVSVILRDIKERVEKALHNSEAILPRKFQNRNHNYNAEVSWRAYNFEQERCATLLNKGLYTCMKKYRNFVLLGEDIEAPYGGAFKITKDLSAQFPGRVKNTPISEAAIIGAGIGLAMEGIISIVEIMFGDFLGLGFDQIINHASKIPFIYGKNLRLPLIIRTPMGGYRGYGPTHSQSIEKHFLGIPNFDVVAMNCRFSPELMYERLVDNLDKPTLVVENKVLYTQKLRTEQIDGFEISYSDEVLPCTKISPKGKEPDLTVVCYGGMLEMVEASIQKVFDEFDIICEVICPLAIFPFNINPILKSVQTTQRLITVEEGPRFSAFGSEVIAQIIESGVGLKKAIRIGNDDIIPASRDLEDQILPNAESIAQAMLKVME